MVDGARACGASWPRAALLLRTAAAWVVLALLGGCASVAYTVDDGRKLDETLLHNIRAYGQGERTLRPAIARSAALRDAECDKQWELPFSIASSAAWKEDERVAWVRALGVDERLTVIAATPQSPLQVGERLEAVAGVKHERDAEALLAVLAAQRDAGKPFGVRTSAGRQMQVLPFQVCRGYARLAPPNTPVLQDYHWLLNFHPLEINQAELSDDEALWLVLWTQGLSEEGGARMKTYHYGVKIVGTLYNLATLASGLRGAAVAAEAAVKAAQSAAASVASEVLKQQLIEQAKSFAMERFREAAVDAVTKLSRATVVSSMQQAAVNRGSLGGVSRIAATVFDRADAWAFERMAGLHANPLAGFMLHQKLAEAGLANNAFVFDAERLSALNKVASAKGLEDSVVAVLKGVRPEALDAAIGAMPLASARSAFSYNDGSASAINPFANGLVAALLGMPGESGAKP